jgi:hypothetical protein
MTITETTRKHLRRTKIALAVLGQSNERGQVSKTETISSVASITAYPQAYASLRRPEIKTPLGPSVTNQGGPLFKLYDDLYDWGYDAQIINASKGSMSMPKDACGELVARANTFAYRAKRAIEGPGDRGCYGDMIVVSNRLFQCTTGRASYVMYNGMTIANETTNVFELDYRRDIGSQASAGSAPTFSAANVGDTVTDGTCVWTCLATSGGNPSYLGQTYFADLRLNSVRSGFDPYGILHQTLEELQRVRDAEFKAVYLGNAQADIARSSADYSSALNNVADFFLSRGIHVFLGLSMFWPGGATTTQYDTLTTGIASTKAFHVGTYPTLIHDGANLYTLMGSTGAMASGGAYFAKDSGQDNLHVNAAGAIVAGGHMANAIKAQLPQLLN